MESRKNIEFCLIAEGYYETLEEAKHALQDPFIEDYVEEHGKFRLQNFEDIRVTSGISLGDLEISMLEEEVFEISCRSSPIVLTQRKAELLAETLRRQAMFDEIYVEPID